MQERIAINDLQAWQGWWESRVLPEEDRTPETRFVRALEEVEEWKQAHEDWVLNPNNKTAKEAAMEFADIAIIGLGYISTLGYDLENLIVEKMKTNHTKYNIVSNAKLREEGMTPQEALAYQKEQWNLQR